MFDAGGEEPRRVPVSLTELLELMQAVFDAGGVFSFAPMGRSMLPMLREKRDTVVLAPAAGRDIRRYDVVLYLRDEPGGVGPKPVLHRVIGVSRAGTFTICGDRQTAPERGVKREQVLGVLTEFTRKGKRVSADNRAYRLYAVVWTLLRPVRAVGGKVLKIFRQIVEKCRKRHRTRKNK